MIWFLFAAMTGASILVLLMALSRRPQGEAAVSVDLDHYRAHMTVLDQGLAKGEIDDEEAEATRTELSRRLLARHRHEPEPTGQAETSSPPLMRRRIAAILALCFVPAAAFALYRLNAAPDLPSAFAQLQQPAKLEQQNVAQLLERLERQLALHPENAQGWDLLGQMKARFGDQEAAVEAYRKAIAYGGETADRLRALGQGLLALSGGVVTQEARQGFERAAALNPADPRIDFFLALAAEQGGLIEDAATHLGAALLKSPADAPWLPAVRDQLAKLLLDQQTEDQAPADKTTPISPIEALRTALTAKATPAADGRAWRWHILARIALEGSASLEPALKEAREALSGDEQALGVIDGFAAKLMPRHKV